MSRVLIWFLKQILIFIVAVLVTSMTFIIARDIIFNHLFVSQWPKQPSTKQTLRSLESSAIMEDTIWIVDTSGDEEVYLKPLQLCGLESIARHHPGHKVVMGFSTPVIPVSSRLATLTSIHPNIEVMHIGLSALFSASPLASLWDSGRVEASSWPVSHTSDLARFMLLARYGGIWLDTDVITIKPLPDVRNFVSVELASKNHLAAGAIKFQRNHPVITDILQNLKKEFSGSEWGANGPLQLTKAMKKFCDDEMWSSDDGDNISQCKDVTVFKEEHFYPINWRQWPWMFKAEQAADAMSRLNKSFIIHLWGSKSQGAAVQADSALAMMASDHCPVSRDRTVVCSSQSEGSVTVSLPIRAPPVWPLSQH